MLTYAQRNFLPILYGVLGVLVGAILLKARGPQTEPISFVDSQVHGLVTEPLALSAEKATRFNFKFLTQSDVPFQGIEFLMGTYDEPFVKIQKAEAVSIDGKCVYIADPGILLQNNSHLRFNRSTCSDSAQEFSVDIEIEKPANVALWSYIASPDSLSSKNEVVLMEQKGELIGRKRLLYGFYQRSTRDPNVTRFELLSYVWDLNIPAPGFMAIVLAFSFGFWFSIAKFLIVTQSPIYCAMAWFFLSGSYALLAPPFQAPDEPDHMLTYAELYSAVSFSNEVLQLAQRGHFERIKFHAHHKFSSSDMGHPQVVGWAPHISAVDMKSRSPLTAYIWWIYSKLFRGLTPSWTLILARLMNSLLVSLGVYALFRSLHPDNRFKIIHGIQLFCMPALPFFAMHMSNYFSSISLILVQCGLLLHLLRKKSTDLWMNFLIGLVVSLGASASVTGIGLIAVWCFLMPWCLFFDSGSTRGAPFSPAKRCASMVGGIAVIQFPLICFRIAKLNSWSELSWRYLTEDKATLAIFVMLGWVLCLSFFRMFWAPTTLRLLSWIQQRTELLGRSIAIFGVLAIACANMAIFFHRFSELPNIEDPAYYLKSIPYGFAAMKAFLLSLTLNSPDRLFSASFWTGFGWLEAYPSDIYILACRLPFVVGSVAFFWHLFYESWSKSISFSWIKLFYVIGILALLFGLATVCSQIPSNLHGRYLIGFYLLLSVLSSLGLNDLVSTEFIGTLIKRNKKYIRMFVPIMIVCIHSFCFWFLLDRYF